MKQRAADELARALRRERREGAIDDRGYAAQLEDNLVSSPSPANLVAIRCEFGAGAGGELSGRAPKLHAAYSSAALAVNSLARWRESREDLARLRLADQSAFTELFFERRCPTGLQGVPPHLDALCMGREGIVAVESKCTELLGEHTARFRDAYGARIRDLGHPSWVAKYEQLLVEPSRYRFLDAAQLVKHYLGLKSTFGNTSVTLLYLYWEAADPESSPIFAAHRAELEDFADGLADQELDFAARAWPEVWEEWEQDRAVPWVEEHVAALKRRYLVALSPSG